MTNTPPQNQRIDYASTLDQRTKIMILAGVLLGLFLAALDQTIVATALPAIVAEFQGIDLLSWVSTGYLLASTTMVPIYGKLSDLYGRRAVLLFGIVVFLGASSLCGIAGSMLQLIIYRVLQGIGAAALTSTAFAIPADLFAPRERARYQGIFGAVFGLSSVIGPYLGGLLTDNINWRWVFYVNLPIGIIAMAFIILKMPKLASGIRAPIDWLGTILLILAVVPLLLGLTLDKNLYPWTSPLILGLFALAIIATAVFLVVESRVASPILPLDLFRNRTYSLINIISVLNGAAFFAAILFLSIFMVNVVGVSATAAGTALIPLTMGVVFGNIASSFVVQRFGRYKLIILVGFVIMAIGFLLLSQMDASVTTLGVTLRMIVVGVGVGPALPLLNLALQNAVPFEKVGVATASRQFFQQIGQTLGAAIFGVILSTTLTAQIAANFAPIQSQIPPQFQSQLDPNQLRNGASGGEGASGEQVDVGTRIRQGIEQQFDNQRTLITAAIRDNDAQAQTTLINNPQTPEEFKAVLQPGGVEAAVQQQLDAQYQQIEAALKSGDAQQLEALKNNPQLPAQLKEQLGQISPQALSNPQAVDQILSGIRAGLEQQKPAIVAQAREQALAGALSGVDAAEASALAQGESLGAQISSALKQSFATSITQIYFYALFPVIAAFLLTLAVPEIPLRTSNRSETVPVFE
ncbi:MAG TPA: DHA2 family efflux MFS transporter permease subunit [Herpetosiphonaceae bacterium]